MGAIPAETTVLKARMVSPEHQAPFAPPPLDEVVATIRRAKPDLVFAPHVETSAGMLLPDDYLRAVAAAVHEHGGLFVLDCIASGADLGGHGRHRRGRAGERAAEGLEQHALRRPGDAGRRGAARIEATTSTSFSLDLKKWLQIMEALRKRRPSPTTPRCPPTAWRTLRDVMQETGGLRLRGRPRRRSSELGDRVRALLAREGIRSVAAPGFQAPGVVVSYTDDVDWAQRPRLRRARACRSPPACRWRWTSRRTSAPSASACSGWTS